MEPNRRHQLSPRQREILLWSCRGKTYVEIGLITGLSKGSIKTYLDQARYKLNVVNLPQACAVAVAEGIFAREDIIPPSPTEPVRQNRPKASRQTRHRRSDVVDGDGENQRVGDRASIPRVIITEA